MRRGSRRRNDNNKRRSEFMDHRPGEDDTVDDLAHAATFAMMGVFQQPGVSSASTPTPTPTPTITDPSTTTTTEYSDDIMPQQQQEQESTDDIDIDIESINSDAGDDGDDVDADDEKDDDEIDVDDDDDDDDDEDDDSDVDLAEALAKMQQVDDDGDDDELEEDENGNQTRSGATNRSTNKRPPKTEHEVDAYRTPIQELEEQLQFQLTVEQSGGTNNFGGGMPSSSSSSSTTLKLLQVSTKHPLPLAGRIKHYMAMDRTVVVESAASNPHGDVARHTLDMAPLDEGTLLVLRPPPPSPLSSAGLPVSSPSPVPQQLSLIPLGRIFEVFGPVSQPLYTIRLPSPLSSNNNNNNNNNKKTAKGKGKPSKQKTTKGIDSKPVSIVATDDATKNGEETNKGESKTSETAVDLPSNESEPTIETEQSANDTPHASTNNDVCTNESSNSMESSTEKTKGDSQTSMVMSDPWAPNGEYAKLLKADSSVAVYYIQEEAKRIDTGKIMKISGKGCDASNLYDEEILNANELYYSDDEKERDAKSSRRKQNRGGDVGRGGGMTRRRDRGDVPDHPSQRHSVSADVANAALPSGFHRGPMPPAVPPPAPQRALPQVLYNPSGPPRPYGLHSVPPPPPRPGVYPPSVGGKMPAAPRPPQPYASYPTSGPPPPSNGAPPPPPPPGSSAPPPAYQY